MIDILKSGDMAGLNSFIGKSTYMVDATVTEDVKLAFIPEKIIGTTFFLHIYYLEANIYSHPFCIFISSHIGSQQFFLCFHIFSNYVTRLYNSLSLLQKVSVHLQHSMCVFSTIFKSPLKK